jgi:hypothetical protein
VCLIVDANVAHVLLKEPTEITKWLLGRKGNPRLIASGLLRRELVLIEASRKMLVQLDRAGRLRRVNEEELGRQEQHLIARGCCRSNDTHVVALALVSGARTLATKDDRLTEDFKDRLIVSNPRGKVYRDPEKHGHLLGHTPQSCGVRASGK